MMNFKNLGTNYWMNSLQDSNYLQDHALKLVQGILNQKDVRPLNNSEVHFMGRRTTFLHIQQEFGEDLVPILRRWRHIMATIDLIDLMIEAHDANSLDYLKEIFESAEENNMSLTKEQFYEVFDSAQLEKIPFSWAVNMLGEDSLNTENITNPKENSFSIKSM